jgi:hypothetical protein
MGDLEDRLSAFPIRNIPCLARERATFVRLRLLRNPMDDRSTDVARSCSSSIEPELRTSDKMTISAYIDVSENEL